MKKLLLVIALVVLALVAAPTTGAQGASCPNPHQVCITVPIYGYRNGVYQIVGYKTVCHRECGL